MVIIMRHCMAWKCEENSILCTQVSPLNKLCAFVILIPDLVEFVIERSYSVTSFGLKWDSLRLLTSCLSFIKYPNPFMTSCLGLCLFSLNKCRSSDLKRWFKMPISYPISHSYMHFDEILWIGLVILNMQWLLHSIFFTLTYIMWHARFTLP